MIWLTSAAIAFSLLQQYPQQTPRTRTPRPTADAGPGANTDAIATFSGAFKSADKKYVNIDVEGGEMRMYLTHSTKFVRDGKPARASDFESGELVTADTARDARFNLLAVKIELVKPPKSQVGAPEKSPDK